MSSQISAKTYTKSSSHFNNILYNDSSFKSEQGPQRKIKQSVDSIYFSDFNIKTQSEYPEISILNLAVLKAIKDLKISIDHLSDTVEKQNDKISKIVTSEEVHERIEKKIIAMKELEKKKNRSEDSNCQIF